jgi:hypothetical protein
MNENKIKINPDLLDETKFHSVNKLLRSYSNGKEYSIIIHDLDSLKIMTHEELLYFCYTFLHIQEPSVQYTFQAAVLAIKHFYPDYCSMPDLSDRHMFIRLETLDDASYSVTKIYKEMLLEIEKQEYAKNLENF